ncbi:MAG: type I restriction enzyme HsdR N-terminal domain-containing protein [Cyanobacteria bacterium KgW148]|nr:type I restriction enzyme HsdR N-terminal domain-containing protein [Cyanobacteria bacterium KgW148]
MSPKPILNPGQSYNFHDYFDLPFEPEDVLKALNHNLRHDTLEFSQGFVPQERLQELQARTTRSLRYVSLSSCHARREVLVAPLLLEVVDLTESQLRIEYPVQINEQLQGTIDYYLYKEEKRLIICEAKNNDLTKGFTQLASQMIALSQWNSPESSKFMGAVTCGDIWQFGVLHTASKTIWQDINLFRVPADLSSLMKVLVAALLP